MSSISKKSDVLTLSALIGQNDTRHRLAGLITKAGATFNLITGAKGSGKHFVAMILAKAILCDRPNKGGACGSCRACTLFEVGNHVDFHELKPDTKTLISTNTVRQAISDLHVMPRLGEQQVLLIDGNLLNEQGQNALLKSLETPPPSMTFIITVDSEQSLLPTIRSRASRIAMTARTPQAIREILKIHGVLADDAIERAISYAGGNPGRALTLARSSSYPVMRDHALNLFFRLPTRRIADLISEDAALLKQYKEATESTLYDVFDVWSEQLHDALVMHTGRVSDTISEKKRLRKFLVDIGGSEDQPARLQRCQREIVRVRRALASYASVDTALAHILLFMRKELHD